jgi:uncharacterized repeat protein (TIGR02543 family)
MSSPTGINCPGDCTQDYDSGTMVTLTAAAASGSTFAGWSNACLSAMTNPVCVVTVDAAKTATATFTTP